ncbi:hypothetical protein [Senegalia massiliensis]|nr:hypothetical protein [Senegalia massiliensis]
MDMRDYLQEIWDKVFIEYKNNKIQLIREYRDNIDYMKVLKIVTLLN